MASSKKTKTGGAKKKNGALKKKVGSAKKAVKRVLSAPLAKKVREQVAAKKARLVDEARADIELIHRRRTEITERFFDVGEALVRLQRPGIAEVLGHKGFADLCEKELSLSVSKANKLVAIVKGVKRSDAAAWGQEKAAALLALAEATPEPDSAALLAGAVMKLPSGGSLDVGKASAAALWSAAKEIRALVGPSVVKRGRGLTTTAEERATAARIERAFRAAGLGDARVTPIAKNKAGAMLRIERVPLAEVDKIRSALSKLRSDK